MTLKFILTTLTCVGIIHPALCDSPNQLPPQATENQPRDPKTEKETLPVVAMGTQKAPVQVIMYHALNCPHCKEFKIKDFPDFKKKYIDTGMVYFEMRDFPIDALSMASAKLAWCKEKTPQSYQKYAQIISKNFRIEEKDQVEVDWANVPTQLDAVMRLTELLGKYGVSSDECKACLQEATPTENAILVNCLEIQNTHKLDYAPGFVVNGTLVEMGDLSKAVDNALAHKQN